MAGSGRPWDDVALCTPPDIGVRNNPARLLLAPTTVEEAFAFPPPLLDITPLLSLALPALDMGDVLATAAPFSAFFEEEVAPISSSPALESFKAEHEICMILSRCLLTNFKLSLRLPTRVFVLGSSKYTKECIPAGATIGGAANNDGALQTAALRLTSIAIPCMVQQQKKERRI